ncbi:hypothetical protein AAVH_16500 [Aphelenchoides avenae]|nr:hypothetical protein AAVH_31879 [Aphelenchus avenae]KAH7716133.1 hypothetical protein AAVH_16500 [Aphelenchus avenae]
MTLVQTDVEAYVFRTLFQFATALNMFIHLYNLFLTLRVTPGSLNDYRHLLISMNAVNILFVITVGILMQPMSLLPFPCTVLQGVFKSFGNGGAETAFLMSVSIAVCSIALQSFCLLYRFIVLRRVQPLNTRRPWFICGLIVSVIFGTATYRVANVVLFPFENVYPAPETAADDSSLLFKDVAKPTDAAMFCMRPSVSVSSPTVFAALIAFASVVLVWYLSCIGIGLRTFVLLRLKSTILSERMYRAHRTMTKYFLIQTTIPAVTAFFLLSFVGISLAASSTLTAFALEMCIVVVLLWPLASAFFTCLYVSPYRRFSKLWLTRLWKGKAVSDTTITVSFSGNSAAADTNISRRSLQTSGTQGMLSGRRLQDNIASRRVSRF